MLFSDLVGWTEQSEDLDAEVARDILAEYHERCGAHVVAYGGTVGQYLGDGILAYFGHPTAYEDNGYRAVIAGLRIVDEVAEVTRRTARAHGCGLAVRVGIHAGLVVAEELTDDPLEPNVVGSPLNLAHRIQSEADPGTVLI
ncbi:MAG: adenylate/guanylate cyclase domain-containing protein, partial [Acidimicrobiales bacterium]